MPLRGATIFLTGRMNITATDDKGNFKLDKLDVGRYSIVITMIGYKALVKDISIPDRVLILNLQLLQQTTILKEVTIKSDKSRLEYLAIFKNKFLGESENASQCKILNSETITFVNDTKTSKLTASSDEVLTIRNQALGYQIKYLLNHFEYDGIRNSVIYEGYSSFEELKGTPDEEEQWKENRRRAYLGSAHQFIRSVYEENCRANGFIVFKIKNRAPLDIGTPNRNLIKVDFDQVSFDSLLLKKDERSKILHFSDALYVIYTKGKEQANYKNKNYSLVGLYTNRWMPEGQVSIVNLFRPVIIDENGLFMPTSRLFFEGYMGWEKIADLVPYEYNLSEQD
jgi:CarboxypepD_reg-like domain